MSISERIVMLLELYSLEEALEVCEVEPQEALEILHRLGYLKLPPFLEDVDDGRTSEE